jgi:hypothetical protein
VLERPQNEAAGPATVCPGQHIFHEVQGSGLRVPGSGEPGTSTAEPGTGHYSVVWWDPGALDLDRKPSFGVRRGELIVKDVPRDVVAEGRTQYDRWHLARADARDSGAVPTILSETVRAWSAADGSEWPAEWIQPADVHLVKVRGADDEEVARAKRPGGIAFGVLVHALLAQAPFDASRATLEAIARIEARLLALDDEDASAAASIVERVLAHDLLARARAADARGACRRETPVTCTLPDGRLLEGVVDLAFEEAQRWTVVDYKTDREIAAAGEDRYRRQVAFYGSAIARATGRPASAVLVRI